MTRNEKDNIVCPYFRAIRGATTIQCESCIGVNTAHLFAAPCALDKYARKHCLNDWRSCYHAKELTLKYNNPVRYIECEAEGGEITALLNNITGLEDYE